MHRTIGYLSKRFAHIRPGEERKVMLTFLYFFLVITAYYVIKPVSRSLVLGELGSRMVPYVDLICALLMGPIVTVFARLVDRVAKPRLVSLSFVAVTAAFWAYFYFRGEAAPPDEPKALPCLSASAASRPRAFHLSDIVSCSLFYERC